MSVLKSFLERKHTLPFASAEWCLIPLQNKTMSSDVSEGKKRCSYFGLAFGSGEFLCRFEAILLALVTA
jgi:hypothetical protein